MSTPDVLLGQSSCPTCFAEADTADLLEFELWAQIATALHVNTDPQTLITNGHCYVCFGASTFQTMKLALLAAISTNHNPANQTDPQSLLTQAKCFACFSDASIPKLMELSLLAQIAT